MTSNWLDCESEDWPFSAYVSPQSSILFLHLPLLSKNLPFQNLYKGTLPRNCMYFCSWSACFAFFPPKYLLPSHCLLYPLSHSFPFVCVLLLTYIGAAVSVTCHLFHCLHIVINIYFRAGIRMWNWVCRCTKTLILMIVKKCSRFVHGKRMDFCSSGEMWMSVPLCWLILMIIKVSFLLRSHLFNTWFFFYILYIDCRESVRRNLKPVRPFFFRLRRRFKQELAGCRRNQKASDVLQCIDPRRAVKITKRTEYC